MHIIHSQPSVLLGSCLSSSHITVVSRVLSCNHSTLIVLLYRQILPNTHHGGCSLSSHVILISHVPSCIHPDLLSKKISSLITPMIGSIWKFLPWWRMSSLTLGFERVLFHSEHLLELLDQEDWVIKRDTSRVMKHNPILQGDMSPTHRRKSCMRGWEVFLLPPVPISSFLHGECIFHRFSCTPHS
jgi:hypothetical protein